MPPSRPSRRGRFSRACISRRPGACWGRKEVGRPRTGDCGEFALLGPAPAPAEAAARLAALDAVVAARDLPAVLVLAIVHAELAHARPFARGNGLVARAMDRVLAARVLGLDPTGVAVLEAGHGASGGAAYQGALQAYGLGTVDGLVLWVEHCGEAIVAGAQEGHAIADSVLAGRLSEPQIYPQAGSGALAGSALRGHPWGMTILGVIGPRSGGVGCSTVVAALGMRAAQAGVGLRSSTATPCAAACR